MSSENFLDLPPLLSARGAVRLPGSKSISNRVLLLAARAWLCAKLLPHVLESNSVEAELDELEQRGWLSDNCTAKIFVQ